MNTKPITLPTPDWVDTHPTAYLITTDGTVKEIAPKNGTDFDLYEMYDLLSCRTIELVYLSAGRLMVCDEEGALKSNRQPNWVATKICSDLGYLNGRLGFFFGDVLIVHNDQIK